MKLMPRDRKVLVKLAAARWLTTRQVAALCFPGVTIEMARRRLRLLSDGRYVFSYRGNQMAEALHGLGAKGRGLLMERGQRRAMHLERRPPRYLEHFVGINDIRVAVERSAQNEGIELGFFLASWELQQNAWSFPIIPDAACHAERSGKSLTILFEYDRGEESARYVARTKFRTYAQGLIGFPFSLVVVVVDTEKRLEELRKQAVDCLKPSLFSFTLLEALKRSWSLANLVS